MHCNDRYEINQSRGKSETNFMAQMFQFLIFFFPTLNTPLHGLSRHQESDSPEAPHLYWIEPV